MRRAFAFLGDLKMSAQYIYDTAPLGSLIRYSNGEPRPPERFRRKLAAWNNDNGTGRLVERYPGQVTDNYRSPAHFMLHLATYGTLGVIVMTVRRAYSVESPLNFEIIDVPKPGQVRVLTTFRDKDELRHLAADMTSAEAWMRDNPYSGMRAEIVTDADLAVLSSELRRAA